MTAFTTAVLSLAAGMHATWNADMSQLPLVLESNARVFAAGYCGVNVGCGGGDQTVTSVLDVDHRVSPGGQSDDPVQLDDSEGWTITAYWSTLTGLGITCSCAWEVSSSVTYAVTHSGTSWSGTCTGCNVGGPIRSVQICDINADNCSSYDGDYRLVVDVDQTNGSAGGTCGVNSLYVNRVNYSVSSIDDGDAFETVHCSLGSSVSPTQSVFTATDFGAFECALNCSATGPALTVIFN